MSPLERFTGQIAHLEHQHDLPLAAFTTFGIGGAADVVVFPHTDDQVLEVITKANQCDLPYFVLGGGSNLLISDAGICGVVIHLKGELAEIKIENEGQQITAGAGASFPKLTHTALKLGWKCALGWCGTPGQVGGALTMNAGTRLGELGEAVKTVYGVSLSGHHVFDRNEIGFSYRKTSFPTPTILTRTLLSAPLIEPETSKDLLAMASELAKKRKATQPKHRSAGSIFKNPVGDFAGRLIESCGLKGHQIGGAQISTVHANFIVNKDRATASDVRQLADYTRTEVEKRFNILLEYEVKFAGSL